jgi:hypothetical protein
MNIKTLVMQELKLRDIDKTGALGNLCYLELLCLAYKLHIAL